MRPNIEKHREPTQIMVLAVKVHFGQPIFYYTKSAPYLRPGPGLVPSSGQLPGWESELELGS